MYRLYSKPRDIEIDYITIGSLRKDDIRDAVLIHSSKDGIQRWAGFSIMEDLFSNFMTCEIFLVDQDGGFLNMLRTEEVITIKFKTPDVLGSDYEFKPRTHYFYLYKIDPVIPLKKVGGAMYSVKGISFENFYNCLRTFSRSYRGKTSQIVEAIYDEYLDSKSIKTFRKKLQIGRETKHEMKFTFPYVNPVDAINYLASVSIDSVNPDICNHVFFENKDGFNFTSITELIEKPRKVHKYATTETGFGPGFSSIGAGIGAGFFNFGFNFDKTMRVTPLKTTDKIVDTLDGVWGEYFADYDMLYKSYRPFFSEKPGKGNSWGKRYIDYFPKTTHLNPKPLLAEENVLFADPLGRNRICFSNRALYSEEQEQILPTGQKVKVQKLFETHEEEYSFQRRSMMQQINGFNVEVEVQGNSEITVGDIFELDTTIYRSAARDKYLSGTYLVTAVNHIVDQQGYSSIVTLSRDSLKSNDFDSIIDFPWKTLGL